MLEALDGPSLQFTVTINNTTPVELKSGASAFDPRKVITVQGDGKFYVYFANDGETPSSTDLSTKGFVQYKNAKESYEASASQAIWVMAETGSVVLRAAERG